MPGTPGLYGVNLGGHLLYALNAIVFGLISVTGLKLRAEEPLDAVGESLLAVTITLTVFNFAAVFQ